MIEMLSATNSPNPPAHMKNMLGGNRKASDIFASQRRLRCADRSHRGLVALAARKWVAAAAKAEPA